MALAPKKRGGKGKKKIVIKRMVNEDARQVTFSKRRRGLFNKASELAILTGAKIAAIVFSPGGRVFSFGHSSVDAVVKRFFAGESAEAEVQDAAYDNKLQKLCQELDALRTELADYKNRKENMDDAMAKDRAAGDQMAAWVEADVDDIGDMGEEDMAKFAAGLMKVQDTVSQRANQVLMEAYNVHYSLKMQVPTPAPPKHFAGSNFEFGSSSSSSANAGMEMQMAMPPTPGFAPWTQMMMPMPSPQGFAAGMHMQQMSMEMPPWQGLATGMNMQQMPMATPPPQGGMLQLLLEMSPATQTEFLGATHGTVDAAFGDGVQQGLGPNAGFPY